MLVVEIEGGLASQMFAYAAARRVGIRHGVDVHIDTRNYRTYLKFRPELHHLDVDAVLLHDNQADALLGPNNQLTRVVQPTPNRFDESILEIEDPNILMRGNYVCEDYFSDISDVLRREFVQVTPRTQYAHDLSKAIELKASEGYEPIAIHVRRGDYLDHNHRDFHGVCGPDYFERATKLMTRVTDNPWYFVFSNDPEWAAGYFTGDNYTITYPPADSPPVEDMMLMAECNHHIIANSGYSWWGAWLSSHENQVVIGPRPFVLEPTINTEHVYPRNWISLSATTPPHALTPEHT